MPHPPPGTPYPPAGGPHPPQSGPWAPQPPTGPKKSWFARHKILTTLFALFGLLVVVPFTVAVVIVAVNGGGGNDSPASVPTTTAEDRPATSPEPEPERTPEPAPQPTPEPAAPGIGVAVQDGKFEFTVTKLEVGPRIGNEFFSQEAQGRFLLVHVTVTNIGNEAQYFIDSNQKLVDTEGRTHSADSGAALYLETNSFLNQINPGNTVDGIVVFDIPVDATPASIELHDSAFSRGVTVSLQ